MRSLPLLLRMAEEMRRIAIPNRAPFYDDFFAPMRWAPWSQLSRLQREMEQDLIEPKIGKDGYQVSLHVGQFNPSELTVKVVDNNVVVEGKYEERADEHGTHSSHFVRTFSLPKGFKADQAISTLSSDGVLTVSVPKPAELEDKAYERVIPIQQTGPAHLNVKENPPVEDKAGKKADKKADKNED